MKQIINLICILGLIGQVSSNPSQYEQNPLFKTSQNIISYLPNKQNSKWDLLNNAISFGSIFTQQNSSNLMENSSNIVQENERIEKSKTIDEMPNNEQDVQTEEMTYRGCMEKCMALVSVLNETIDEQTCGCHSSLKSQRVAYKYRDQFITVKTNPFQTNKPPCNKSNSKPDLKIQASNTTEASKPNLQKANNTKVSDDHEQIRIKSNDTQKKQKLEGSENQYKSDISNISKLQPQSPKVLKNEQESTQPIYKNQSLNYSASIKSIKYKNQENKIKILKKVQSTGINSINKKINDSAKKQFDNQENKQQIRIKSRNIKKNVTNSIEKKYKNKKNNVSKIISDKSERQQINVTNKKAKKQNIVKAVKEQPQKQEQFKDITKSQIRIKNSGTKKKKSTESKDYSSSPITFKQPVEKKQQKNVIEQPVKPKNPQIVNQEIRIKNNETFKIQKQENESKKIMKKKQTEDIDEIPVKENEKFPFQNKTEPAKKIIVNMAKNLKNKQKNNVKEKIIFKRKNESIPIKENVRWKYEKQNNSKPIEIQRKKPLKKNKQKKVIKQKKIPIVKSETQKNKKSSNPVLKFDKTNKIESDYKIRIKNGIDFNKNAEPLPQKVDDYKEENPQQKTQQKVNIQKKQKKQEEEVKQKQQEKQVNSSSDYSIRIKRNDINNVFKVDEIKQIKKGDSQNQKTDTKEIINKEILNKEIQNEESQYKEIQKKEIVKQDKKIKEILQPQNDEKDENKNKQISVKVSNENKNKQKALKADSLGNEIIKKENHIEKTINQEQDKKQKYQIKIKESKGQDNQQQERQTEQTKPIDISKTEDQQEKIEKQNKQTKIKDSEDIESQTKVSKQKNQTTQSNKKEDNYGIRIKNTGKLQKPIQQEKQEPVAIIKKVKSAITLKTKAIKQNSSKQESKVATIKVYHNDPVPIRGQNNSNLYKDQVRIKSSRDVSNYYKTKKILDIPTQQIQPIIHPISNQSIRVKNNKIQNTIFKKSQNQTQSIQSVKPEVKKQQEKIKRIKKVTSKKQLKNESTPLLKKQKKKQQKIPLKSKKPFTNNTVVSKKIKKVKNETQIKKVQKKVKKIQSAKIEDKNYSIENVPIHSRDIQKGESIPMKKRVVKKQIQIQKGKNIKISPNKTKVNQKKVKSNTQNNKNIKKNSTKKHQKQLIPVKSKVIKVKAAPKINRKKVIQKISKDQSTEDKPLKSEIDSIASPVQQKKKSTKSKKSKKKNTTKVDKKKKKLDKIKIKAVKNQSSTVKLPKIIKKVKSINPAVKKQKVKSISNISGQVKVKSSIKIRPQVKKTNETVIKSEEEKEEQVTKQEIEEAMKEINSEKQENDESTKEDKSEKDEDDDEKEVCKEPKKQKPADGIPREIRIKNNGIKTIQPSDYSATVNYQTKNRTTTINFTDSDGTATISITNNNGTQLLNVSGDKIACQSQFCKQFNSISQIFQSQKNNSVMSSINQDIGSLSQGIDNSSKLKSEQDQQAQFINKKLDENVDYNQALQSKKKLQKLQVKVQKLRFLGNLMKKFYNKNDFKKEWFIRPVIFHFLEFKIIKDKPKVSIIKSIRARNLQGVLKSFRSTIRNKFLKNNNNHYGIVGNSKLLFSTSPFKKLFDPKNSELKKNFVYTSTNSEFTNDNISKIFVGYGIYKQIIKLPQQFRDKQKSIILNVDKTSFKQDIKKIDSSNFNIHPLANKENFLFDNKGNLLKSRNTNFKAFITLVNSLQQIGEFRGAVFDQNKLGVKIRSGKPPGLFYRSPTSVISPRTLRQAKLEKDQIDKKEIQQENECKKYQAGSKRYQVCILNNQYSGPKQVRNLSRKYNFGAAIYDNENNKIIKAADILSSNMRRGLKNVQWNLIQKFIKKKSQYQFLTFSEQGPLMCSKQISDKSCKSMIGYSLTKGWWKSNPQFIDSTKLDQFYVIVKNLNNKSIKFLNTGCDQQFAIDLMKKMTLKENNSIGAVLNSDSQLLEMTLTNPKNLRDMKYESIYEMIGEYLTNNLHLYNKSIRTEFQAGIQ